MTISDDTIALAIPSALKSDHPDSALVVQALAVALAACEDSGAMTAKGRMRDVHAALSSVYVPLFQAHIAKEDEDWSALKAKADKYRPNVVVTYKRSGVDGDASFTYTGAEDGRGVVVRDWARDDSGNVVSRAYVASKTPSGTRTPSEWVESDTPYGALRALFQAQGLTVERIDTVKGSDGNGPAPEPEPQDTAADSALRNLQNAARERGDLPSIDSQLAGLSR